MAVQFDEPIPVRTRSLSKRTSLITSLFLKTGVVKTEAGARVLMLVTAIVALVVAGYLFMQGSVTVEPPSANEVFVQ